MRAVQLQGFGAPEVLELVDLPAPTPSYGEVAIRVSHAGVNFADVMTRRGGYHGAGAPPIVPGLEVAGTVASVGSGVDGLRPGQPVAAFTRHGGYTEVAIADALLTFPLADDDVDLALAAGAGIAATTATFLVDEVARVRSGDVVLVHAAAGGVGTVLGQLARHRGARLVLGTVGREDKIAYAQGFGYDAVVLREGFGEAVARHTDGAGPDVVFDSVGGTARTDSLAALRPLGRLVAFGNASGAAEATVDSAELRTTNRSVLGFSLGSLRRTDPARVRPVATRALDDVAGGRLRIDLADVLPLTDAVQAHRALESGRSRGKIVLDVGGRA